MGQLFDEIKHAKSEFHRRNMIDDVLDQLPDKEQSDLIAALGDTTIPATVISRVMSKRGFKLPAASVTAYRRGELRLANGSE